MPGSAKASLLRWVAALCIGSVPFSSAVLAQTVEALPGTSALEMTGDLSAQMVEGIARFLDERTARSAAGRSAYWKPDLTSNDAYERSVEPNRDRLRKMIGTVDDRLPIDALEFVESTARPSLVARTPLYTVHAVRWPVLEGMEGEGLWLRPTNAVRGRIVVLPDADQLPEAWAGLTSDPTAEPIARWMAEQGCEVVIATLVDRRDTWSGNPRIRMTNQPHREWIYRQAYEMGRQIVGYEVQKVAALVDWFTRSNQEDLPVGVVGQSEGGVIALLSIALDRRIDAGLVIDSFGPREQLWQEPIYRNLFGYLREFGDAELAALAYPRRLVLAQSGHPVLVEGPPSPRDGRSGAAPGRLVAPDADATRSEIERIASILGPLGNPGPVHEFLVARVDRPSHPDPKLADSAAGLRPACLAFLEQLGIASFDLPTGSPAESVLLVDADARQKRQVTQMVEFNQRLLRRSAQVRSEFWKDAKPTSPDVWKDEIRRFREIFWNDVIGRLPDPDVPPRPRTRKILDQPKWTGYEVVLDVWDGVFAWGYLLVPKGMAEDEKRPVVVCQHGLEGVPNDVVTQDPGVRASSIYKGYAAQLADRGFVVYAPHNPYRGQDKFRVLQRKANPLGLSLFSVIIGQHQQLLTWLGSLPFVDKERIGFYGLSYGGKTAMRVPAVLEQYALSICSADFNEWIWKNVTVDDRFGYTFTPEYEMFEFNLGQTFNYAEMANLIAPRPFMVERGHDDGVAPDEQVAFEFAKVRRQYAYLGIPDRTEIEFFNGPHAIHGVGTFAFLHRHLKWPVPESSGHSDSPGKSR